MMSTLAHAPSRSPWRSYLLEAKCEFMRMLREPAFGVPVIAFPAMFYLLFWFCLNTVGVQFPFPYMFFAFTLSRLLTAVAVTPGGMGVTETATASLMVGWGADPAQATAGVVLFSLFTNFLEVPLGAIGWVFWSLSPKNPATD
jgi:uncharacterized protein (TIRG00374 family)